jgi:hypothetical protein
VDTPLGARGYGVLVAEAGSRWRARIVTFPNILWMIPGGGESIKFLARSEEEAVREASDFIRQHCTAKGYLMRDELQFVEPLHAADMLGAQGRRPGPVAPRYRRRLTVRYGLDRPTQVARTANMSASGLFVTTDRPLASGVSLGLVLELEHCKVPLRGTVVWSRSRPQYGHAAGMGLRLIQPPPAYVNYVRALG